MKKLLLVLSIAVLALSSDPGFARGRSRPRQPARKPPPPPVCESPRYSAAQDSALKAPRLSKKDGSVDMRVNPKLVDEAGKIAEAGSVKTDPLNKFNNGQVVITDGYRTCDRNRHTRGSAKNSAHLRGEAIDIRSRNNPEAYALAIRDHKPPVHEGGGFFNNCVQHVHLDTEHPTFMSECGGSGNFGRKGPSHRSSKHGRRR
jgi:hypothetical protein